MKSMQETDGIFQLPNGSWTFRCGGFESSETFRTASDAGEAYRDYLHELYGDYGHQD